MQPFDSVRALGYWKQYVTVKTISKGERNIYGSNLVMSACHARMKQTRTTKMYNAISLCLNMKPIPLPSITYNKRTNAALYKLDMKANFSYFFFSQRYERDCLSFVVIEKDPNQALLVAIQATHHIQ